MFDLLPDRWVRAMSPMFADFRAQRLEIVSQIQSILFHHDDDGSKSHATAFHSLRDDDDLLPIEKSLPRLVTEASSLTAAGTLTTTHMLSATTYHILNNPPILSKLMAELETAFPDAATACSLQALKKLPYLSSVISEGLRLSYGTIHRLQRVYPDNVLTYRDWIIAPGTPVGMSPLFMHNGQATFPDPQLFDPSRFIGPEKENRQRHLFIFGKGTRQCVGMNLAQAEIHMALGSVFRKFGAQMHLYDTIREKDVDVKHDFFVTNPSMDSRGVRVALDSK